jgi:adenosylcobyric acid synthase
MIARTIMVQGTASSVGKSIVAAGLCRLLSQDGLRVAPFKAQNMALNAFVTADGGEIGRAQAVQAAAARLQPTVDMNPILLKPEGDARSQVVVLGRALGSFSAAEYHEHKAALRQVVADALMRLRSAHDVVVIEGAGSPAEVNLQSRDLVNMFVAELADAPVLLVGDIDRGGVLAALVGTLELLEPSQRARVAGLVINKFRGDLQLLAPALEFLHARTGVPVLGVLPYLRQLRIADEDSLALDDRPRGGWPSAAMGPGAAAATEAQLRVAVIRLPRISNHDEFQPLEEEPSVALRFIDDPHQLAGADLVVVPGTKSTLADLRWLRRSGMADALLARAVRGGPVLGVCGGCQLLGASIADPHRVESEQERGEGLGLLDIVTEFGSSKRTAQVRVRAAHSTFLLTDDDDDDDLGGAHEGGDEPDQELTGYEIHLGRITARPDAPTPRAALEVVTRNGRAAGELDGAVSADGVVVGTMVHGLFDNARVRRTLIGELRRRRGLPPVALGAPRGCEFDRLAAMLRSHLDLAQLRALIWRDR